LVTASVVRIILLLVIFIEISMVASHGRNGANLLSRG